ncbi:MAG TPA: FtsX-like permease family protein [Gemmatimonadaceae bacterium]|nr:FtsX-like permease family protein [Gemmatimonadaceae bacterium]
MRFARRGRTLLAIAGVAVSAAMLLDMVMLSSGMRASFRQLLVSRGYQLRLAPRGTLPFDTEATISGASAIEAALAADTNVVAVSPVLGGQIHVVRGDSTVTAALLGLHPPVQGDYELLAGRHPAAPTELVMSGDMLEALGVALGDTLTAGAGYDPQLRQLLGGRSMTVVGRARFLYMAAGQKAAAMPLEEMQAMSEQRRDRVSLFMVMVREGADVERMRRDIESRLPSVSAISIETAIAQVDERLSYFRQLAVILGAVSFAVGFLLVTTIVTVSVNERIGEIAVLRAIGVTRARIVRRIATEGLILMLAGGILGLGLGLVTARYLNSILASFPGLPASIDFFLFEPRDAWEALGLLMVAGVLACIYPAARAARLPIAATLREEAIG